MKKLSLFLTAALPVILASCATPPRQAFHKIDSTALVVSSLDPGTCQVLAPTSTPREDNSVLLAQARSFATHETAVIILENYVEPVLGREFRDRSLGWFIGLRGLGYEHILFLKGNGTTNPDGLPVLCEY